MWPAVRRGLARSNALLLSTRRASACTMVLLAWAMAAVARASAGVVLGELGIERVGDEPRQHVALLHAHTLVGQHLGDAQAFDLGPDQDLLARHQRAGGQHRFHEVGRRDAGDRHGRGEHQRIVGWRHFGAAAAGASTVAPRQLLADQRERDHQEAERQHGADQDLSHDRPSLRGLVVVVGVAGAGCTGLRSVRISCSTAGMTAAGIEARGRRRGARTCRRTRP